MPIWPKASFFLRFSVTLLVLPTLSLAALPPDDLHLFATIFIVLFVCAVVISFGFAASLYLLWHKKSEKGWKNSHPFVQWGNQSANMTASNHSSMPNCLVAFCSNSLRNALDKISNALKRGGQNRSVTHFPSASPQPSYVSVMSPNELSPQQYYKFPSWPPQNGQVPSSSSRLRSILKKPKALSALRSGGQKGGTVAAATVSYRIPVLRAENGPPVERAPPPQVPPKWEWNAHFREMRNGADRVVEDRVEREECLRNGRLVAVERLTRTIRASADIGGGHSGGGTYI